MTLVDVAHHTDDGVDGVDADESGVHVVVCSGVHEVLKGLDVFGAKDVGENGGRVDEADRAIIFEAEGAKEESATFLVHLEDSIKRQRVWKDAEKWKEGD